MLPAMSKDDYCLTRFSLMCSTRSLRIEGRKSQERSFRARRAVADIMQSQTDLRSDDLAREGILKQKFPVYLWFTLDISRLWRCWRLWNCLLLLSLVRQRAVLGTVSFSIHLKGKVQTKDYVMSSDFDPLSTFWGIYIYIIRAPVLAVNFPKTWNKHFLYAITWKIS